MRFVLFICLLIGAVASGQVTSSITPNGALNAASYNQNAPLAPGSIVAVFGKFPVTSPASALGAPLSTSLAGLSVRFGSAPPAPLFYASGGQINAQVPWELTGQTQASLTVSSNGAISSPLTVNLAPFSPGIFTTNAQGTGQGAVLDPLYQLVDSSHPAKAGVTVIQIYCTGLGPVTNQPPTGAPAPIDLLSKTMATPQVTIGGANAHVQFSGLAPGFVGTYQVNALVPATSATGSTVPVTISIGGFSSNTVQIAIQPNSDQLADLLLSQMTQNEKLQLVHGAGGSVTSNTPIPRGAASWVPGIPRLGIPDLYLADGSVGAGNGLGPATALPSSIASAASWDLNEAYKYGQVIGSELRAYGINVNLGGNVNLIGREPRDGRTFETKGEDPILAGRIAAAHIRGVQDQHVLGGIKHFALNDQETDRTSANAQIDERGARESDLLAFEIGVKDSNVQSVMCSYNLLNGTWACENAHLLNDVLKGDWGFPGYVMSDWWGTHSTAAAALAGLDQEQPNPAYFGSLGSAVANGQVPQARLDNMVHRILRAMYETGLFDYPPTVGTVDTAAGQAVAQEAEEQGAVLLKNANQQLPLHAAALHLVGVIGSHADIGVLSGGGSAQVWPTGGAALTEGFPCPPCWAQVVWDPSSPLRAIRALAPNATVTFDSGTTLASAAALAAASDIAIVFVSQWTSEGMDIPSLNFTDVIHNSPIDQDGLVTAVAAANPHTIVVLENGGAQVMPWLNSVSSVLEAWFPGQRGAEAIANILFGRVNPSGKLPLTFPASVTDLPRQKIAASRDGSTPFPVAYSEGFNVGYKWYDMNHRRPLFPFGFGLSYTTFSFSNQSLTGMQVDFDLTNTGTAAGAEVAQIYLALPVATNEPPKRLVAWQKVYLQPGARQHVTITIDPNDSSHPLSYWDVNSNTWRMAPGDYTVYLGNSSSNLTQAGIIHINSQP